jgi:hypothetical protein
MRGHVRSRGKRVLVLGVIDLAAGDPRALRVAKFLAAVRAADVPRQVRLPERSAAGPTPLRKAVAVGDGSATSAALRS